MPKTAEPWSLTSLREKLIKIGAKVVSHGRYVTFQMAEVAVPRQIRGYPDAHRAAAVTTRPSMTGRRVRWDRGRRRRCALIMESDEFRSREAERRGVFGSQRVSSGRILLRRAPPRRKTAPKRPQSGECRSTTSEWSPNPLANRMRKLFE
jgi:hypothetical protein